MNLRYEDVALRMFEIECPVGWVLCSSECEEKYGVVAVDDFVRRISHN